MLEMLSDFIPLTVVTFLSFVGVGVVETFILKFLKRLESPKNLFYAVSANFLGFLITLLVGVFILFAFLSLFSTTLGGAFGLAALSVIALGILIALIPILMFIARFFLFRYFEITETKFRVTYSLISTFSTLIALFIFMFLVSKVVFFIFPDFAV